MCVNYVMKVTVLSLTDWDCLRRSRGHDRPLPRDWGRRELQGRSTCETTHPSYAASAWRVVWVGLELHLNNNVHISSTTLCCLVCACKQKLSMSRFNPHLMNNLLLVIKKFHSFYLINQILLASHTCKQLIKSRIHVLPGPVLVSRSGRASGPVSDQSPLSLSLRTGGKPLDGFTGSSSNSSKFTSGSNSTSSSSLKKKKKKTL